MIQNLSYPRVYLISPFKPDKKISISSTKSYHLIKVIKVRLSDTLIVFNGYDGEWTATISNISRGIVEITLRRKIKVQNSLKPLILLFSPIKKSLTAIIIQKATELGVTEVCPVITERTNITEINIERLVNVSIGASEQSGRLSLPLIKEPVGLSECLENWFVKRPLYFADKNFRSSPISNFIANKSFKDTFGAGFLVGPEGGFSDKEIELVLSYPFVEKVFLGTRILRSETASISLLSIWQAFRGDWIK